MREKQEEIDDTGREVTADDWDHSYRSIQIDLVTTPRSLPAPPAATGQQSGIRPHSVVCRTSACEWPSTTATE